MVTPGAPSQPDLRRRLTAAGQPRLVAAWERLDAAGRARLEQALAAIDLDLVPRLARLASAPPPAPPRGIEPAEVFPLARDARLESRAREARARGAELLAAGKVGFLLVAGGQGSRLGLDAPKGVLGVGPLTGRSLYELFARRVLAARARYGARVPWYVLTSPATDAPTREFFRHNAWFGLPREEVVFFEQGTLPALDERGEILLGAPDAPFRAPDGHGGVLRAMKRSGALEHAARFGIEHFSYFQVDNPLARPADPLFLGLHALEGARMSSKVVRKRDAAEKVGVLARVNGRMACIEYSDLPSGLRTARASDGSLLHSAGNIALHAIDRTFVEELTAAGHELPWHVARKRIACVDEHGRPTEVEGFKFEAFVFDALSQSPKSVTLEVERASEFSPIKNATGDDSPATARRDQCQLHARWVASAGLALPGVGADGLPPVEVDPLFAEDAEEFRARLPAAPRTVRGGHVYAP